MNSRYRSPRIGFAHSLDSRHNPLLTFFLPAFLGFGLVATVQAQVDVTDNFDLGTDAAWQHYMPGTAGGQVNQYSFPADGSGGKGYRMVGPPLNCAGAFNRGGSYRSEQYSEFLLSVDLLNFDPTPFGSGAFIGSRIASPGAGSTQGYVLVYSMGSPRQRMEVLTDIEFTGEVISTLLDPYRGGTALTPQFPASRKLRAVFTGMTNQLRGEIYDRTDLLEPLARINYEDFVNPTVHNQGENLLGWLNLDMHSVCDFTYDNYHSSGNHTGAPGFPGVAQVVNLKPAAQTLFYQPPGLGSNITFNITTFTVNQINSNSLAVFLNGTQVPASQLVLSEVRDPLVGTHNTNFFVRYTGSLSPNTVYHGQIIVLDTTGVGTTNNWYFDTFRYFDPTDPSTISNTGFILVEAEDYNYASGLFIDAPPVSGTDDTTTSQDPIYCGPGCNTDPQETLGPQVNGNPNGYYGAAATFDIDYHDNSLRTGRFDSLTRFQYRPMDKAGTIQGTKGGGLDTPRQYRMNLPNSSGGTSYVPDYVVADMNAGDWMNYTRTFPGNYSNYVVYLRASSQGRQDVRFDAVSTPAPVNVTNQTTALVGQFLVPNTEGSTRFRYIPMTDAAGNIQTLTLGGPNRTNTFRLTANEVRMSPIVGTMVGDLQLNWFMFVPVTTAASTGPWLAKATPSPNSDRFAPDGTVELIILNRGTTVQSSSIQLRFDGSNVTSAAGIFTAQTAEGPGATVRYKPPGFMLPNSVHTISLVYSDGSVTQSNQWNFTIDNIPLITSNQAVAGPADTSFALQLAKATNNPSATACPLIAAFDPNTTSVAERHLANQIINPDTQAPYPNEIANQPDGVTALATETNVINYEANGNPFGYFTGTTPFPLITPGDPRWPNGPQYFAMSAKIKLQLNAGVYRMGVRSDDQFKLTTGPVTGTELYLGSSETFPGVTGPDGDFSPPLLSEFDFVVQSNGVYQFRLLYNQKGGAAGCQWYYVNRLTGARRLVNQALPTIPASFASPPGSGGALGFAVQMNKATNGAPDTDFPNTVARAEAQLANQIIDGTTGQPYVNEVANSPNNVGMYSATNPINFEMNGNFAGFFTGDMPFPGITPGDPRWGSNPTHFAMAATTYLALQPGTYSFGVRSDDGFKLDAGPTLGATNINLGVFDGGRASDETTFDFIVQTAGLYPVRLLYFQGAGGADVELYSFDPVSGARILVNDPNTAGAIKAYSTLASIQMTNPRLSGGSFTFDFPTVSGKTYTVEFKNNLTDATWTPLSPSISGDGTVHTVGYPATLPSRFYHLRVN